MKVHQFINGMRTGAIQLPEFQRGYVWAKQKSVDLMDSLYREYPIGSVTIWDTDEGKQLIIDGQQRLSSIYACYTDDVPQIHVDSEKKPFTGMYFNLDTEKFQFASQRVRSSDHMWIKVSDIMQAPNSNKAKAWRSQIKNSSKYDEERQNDYEEQVTKIRRIRDIDLPILTVSSDRKSDEVMDMFKRMNTKGTSVKRWEIEMARMAITWTAAKKEIVAESRKYQDTVFGRRMNEEAIIRTMTAIFLQRYTREGLEGASLFDLRSAFHSTQQAHSAATESLVTRFGLRDKQSVPTLATFPAIATFLNKHNGRFPTAQDEAKAMAYFILSGRGVFHGSTDSQIDSDVRAAAGEDNPWDTIYDNARQHVGGLNVTPEHFQIARQRRARTFSLVHIFQMKEDVCDWDTGLPIRRYEQEELEQHHIFPKDLLMSAGMETPKVDAMANIALITGDTNRRLTNIPPDVYLAEFDDKDGGRTLDAHCIPRDRNLWRMANYDRFLVSRRELMADAINELLSNLMNGRFV